jgi:hypothetical protein
VLKRENSAIEVLGHQILWIQIPFHPVGRGRFAEAPEPLQGELGIGIDNRSLPELVIEYLRPHLEQIVGRRIRSIVRVLLIQSNIAGVATC